MKIYPRYVSNFFSNFIFPLLNISNLHTLEKFLSDKYSVYNFQIGFRNLDWRKIKYIYICIDERIKLNEGKNIERNIQTFHTRERSMEKNYFSIIFHHTDRNNKREKISFYLYITYIIYIFLIIPIFTYLYRQVRNTKYIQYKYTSCHHSIFLPSP